MDSLKNILKKFYFKKIILIFLFLFQFFILSCNKSVNKILKPEKIPPINILYNQAYEYFKDGDWNDSIRLFQKVETRYSFSDWAPRASLMIMYMYYETGDSFKTLEYVKKYQKLYPKSNNLDYVSFIKALTFYEQINVVSRDQTYTRAALKEFKYIINKYPNTVYSEEAILKIDLIREQLAGKEMYIARYYMKKSKWIPAIKRLKIILNKFDDTVYSTEALHRLVEIYYNLGNIVEAKKYASILGYNFNYSKWYKKSYQVITKKNYELDKKKVRKKLRQKIEEFFKFSK